MYNHKIKTSLLACAFSITATGKTIFNLKIIHFLIRGKLFDLFDITYRLRIFFLYLNISNIIDMAIKKGIFLKVFFFWRFDPQIILSLYRNLLINYYYIIN